MMFKKQVFGLFIGCFIFFSSFSVGAEETTNVKPPAKTIKINYKIENQTSSGQISNEGEKVIYIDVVNNRRKEEESYGKSYQTFTLIKNHKQYGYDSFTNRAVVTDRANHDSLIGDKFVIDDNVTLAGQENIAGKLCDVYADKKDPSQKVWRWNGLTLKSKNKLGGSSLIIVATNIEENISLDDQLFELPPDKVIMIFPRKSGHNEEPVLV